MSRLAVVFALMSTIWACGKDAAPPPAGGDTIRPRSNPIEYVGLTAQRRVTLDEAVAILDPLFGPGAVAGTRHHDFEIEPGVLLTVSEDPRTTDQLVVALDMVPPGKTPPQRRTIARVPVSPLYGAIYLDTVRAALTQANATRAADPSDSRPWFLEYRSFTANGGALTIKLDYAEDGTTT